MAMKSAAAGVCTCVFVCGLLTICFQEEFPSWLLTSLPFSTGSSRGTQHFTQAHQMKWVLSAVGLLLLPVLRVTVLRPLLTALQP